MLLPFSSILSVYRVSSRGAGDKQNWRGHRVSKLREAFSELTLSSFTLRRMILQAESAVFSAPPTFILKDKHRRGGGLKGLGTPIRISNPGVLQ